jgi:hypothetical protein
VRINIRMHLICLLGVIIGLRKVNVVLGDKDRFFVFCVYGKIKVHSLATVFDTVAIHLVLHGEAGIIGSHVL